jgi:hypothetical protein
MRWFSFSESLTILGQLTLPTWLPGVEGELWMIIPRADSSSSNRLLQEISYCYPIRLLLHSKSSRNSFVLVHYPSNRVGVVAPI